MRCNRQETAHLGAWLPLNHSCQPSPGRLGPESGNHTAPHAYLLCSICQGYFTIGWILSVPWLIHNDCFTCHLNLVSKFARVVYSFESAVMMLPNHNGWRGHVRMAFTMDSLVASQWLVRYSSYGDRVSSDYKPMFWTQKSKSWLDHQLTAWQGQGLTPIESQVPFL